MDLRKWKWPLVVSLAIHFSTLLILFGEFPGFKAGDIRLASGQTILLSPLIAEIRTENRQRPHRMEVRSEVTAPRVANAVHQPFHIGRERALAKSEKSESAHDAQNSSDEAIVSPDEALFYRLSLARAIRASRKHASSLAGYEREGYVELAIERPGPRLNPKVALKHSSGEDALDNAARALIAEAISQRPFPAKLNALSVALLYEAGHPD